MRYPFEAVGVFGTSGGGGSPLAVVHDAEGLGMAEMGRIAERLRADEVVFVLPPTEPEATHRVRVFNRAGESPFGGHSAVGTAVALVRSGRLPAGRLVQQCGARLLELRADERHATITATDPLPSEELQPAPLLDAVGLTADDLGDGPPLAAGFGPRFHLLPVRKPALGALRADPAALREHGLPDLFVFHWDEAARTATARLFAPGYAIEEDPACASVGLALAVWLRGRRESPAGDLRFEIRQGAEVGRPSVLGCALVDDGKRPFTATVSGAAPQELAGELEVPALLGPGRGPGPALSDRSR
ncbi:PhzF family phenazine biosynthesis protein [Streptomyces sp. BRB081]|uniref:PhzF family phenazine biosynthesis protein n=1 Tax=Streptomyces sp. BRB081 TaxID=2769544 RepID=UPI0018ACE83A|nr:PhzF family phenazine biosynthesis isomerase [Streptomyces sp. BRB081]MBL3808340.1 PhzF family phenazine biosynthesis protein [Streptomyces sp. BRB081]